MKKVTTMKDIANAAGVSLTTVSYVLNNSTKQKISHEMRLKIHELAHVMNYVPNLAAKSLARRRSNILGVIILANKNCCKSRLYAYYDLIEELRRQADLIGYDIITIVIEDIAKDVKKVSNHSFDGVIIIDSPSEHMYEITNRCYVPIVFVDSIVNDPIFATVISDYNCAINEAKSMLKTDELFLVIDNFNSNNFMMEIFSCFSEENIFVKDAENSLESFLKLKKNMCGVVVGDILGLIAEKICDNNNLVVITTSSKNPLVSDTTKKIVLSNKSKSKQVLTILKKKIDFIFDSSDEGVLLAKSDD